MPKVKKLGVLLSPTRRSFENQSVLNPAILQEGNTLHLLYRAVNKKFHSSIGYARLSGPFKVEERFSAPIMAPEYSYESRGIEDPRLVKIKDRLYMFYTAHDGKNALGAYAAGPDIFHLKKKGVITPKIKYHRAAKLMQKSKLKDAYYYFEAYYEENAGEDVLLWEKDISMFPKKIKGRYWLLHRVLPDIQAIPFKNFSDLKESKTWKKHLSQLAKYVVLENKHYFESRNIGGGAPPIETDAGWLVIFHAVEETNSGRRYHASAALLDKNNPLKVIGRLNKPLISPTAKWEREGFVKDIVFPTGTAVFGSKLYIYYGAADTRIAVAETSLYDLIKELKQSKPK